MNDFFFISSHPPQLYAFCHNYRLTLFAVPLCQYLSTAQAALINHLDASVLVQLFKWCFHRAGYITISALRIPILRHCL